MSRVTNLAPRFKTLGTKTGNRAAVKRITGRRLQQIRAFHFAADPLCTECLIEGNVTEAVDLDHKVAIINGGQESPDNRQGLCKRHHDAKTKVDMAIAYGQVGGVG